MTLIVRKKFWWKSEVDLRHGEVTSSWRPDLNTHNLSSIRLKMVWLRITWSMIYNLKPLIISYNYVSVSDASLSWIHQNWCLRFSRWLQRYGAFRLHRISRCHFYGESVANHRTSSPSVWLSRYWSGRIYGHRDHQMQILQLFVLNKASARRTCQVVVPF